MRPIIVALIVLIVAAGVWLAVSQPWSKPAPATAPTTGAQPPQPLQPKAEYVKVAEEFLSLWAADNGTGAYALLTAPMKQAVTAEEYARQVSEMKLSNPLVVAHTAAAEAAYVIAHVEGHPPAGSPPFKGMQILLKQENKQWRVALTMPMEKISQKYEDLKLAPGTQAKQWAVTYQDESGQIVTQTLPEL